MSKKKVAARSTMTLKDFHGGSIPSDLPLPSAPGMTADRSAYERQGSGTWMNSSLGRGFGGERGGYSRPGFSNVARSVEDKASYFPNPANIGRNYDEDERKPADGRPRSSHSVGRFDEVEYDERRTGFSMDRYSLDEQGTFGNSAVSYLESRALTSSERYPPAHIAPSAGDYLDVDYGAQSSVPTQARGIKETQIKQQVSYQREFIQTPPEQQGYQTVAVSSLPQQQAASSPPRSWKTLGSHQVAAPSTRTIQEPTINVWTARREEGSRVSAVEYPADNTTGTAWRAQGSAKLSEVSALDMVSSGRWQTDALRRTTGSILTPGSRSEESQSFAGYVNQFTYPSDGGGELADSRLGIYEEETRTVGALKRTSVNHPNRVTFTDSLKGDELDRAGEYGEERGGGRLVYSNVSVRRSDAYDSEGRDHSGSERVAQSTGRGSYTDMNRAKSDAIQVSYFDAGKGVESGRVDEENRYNIAESSRYGREGLVGSGRVFQQGTQRDSYIDRSGMTEDREGIDHLAYSENGKSLYADERGASVYSREDSKFGYATEGNRIAVGGFERSRSPSSLERSRTLSPDAVRSTVGDPWRSGNALISQSESSRAAQSSKSEQAERPKLKLLPRSKPLEREEAGGLEKGLDVKRPADILSVDDERYGASELGVNSVLSELNDEVSRKPERPKLNLKPRSQITDAEVVDGSEKVRQSVFGGARPRELVLKERGVDESLSPSETGLSVLAAGGKVDSVERQESWGEEKQDSRRSERPDRGYDRQASKDGVRGERDERKDYRRDQERTETRRNTDKLESRRESERVDTRRDVDKQDNWRRPSESSVVPVGGLRSATTTSSLIDSTPRSLSVGKHGYSSPASALELAQAFSRSTSIGSSQTGAARVMSNLRSPVPKSPSQIYGSGHGNGNPSSHGTRDAPFSRLAEPPAPSSAVSSREAFQGINYGGDGLSNGYGTGKQGPYGAPSFGRTEVTSGRDRDEYDDFPGKRGLPLRQNEGYYD